MAGEVTQHKVHLGVSYQFRSDNAHRLLHAICYDEKRKMWVKVCNGHRAAERGSGWDRLVECGQCRTAMRAIR